MRRMTGRNNRPLKRLRRETGVRWPSRCLWAIQLKLFGRAADRVQPRNWRSLRAEVRACQTQSEHAAQHSPAHHRKMRNANLSTSTHRGIQICQPCRWGDMPPDLKGCGLSRTWQHGEVWAAPKPPPFCFACLRPCQVAEAVTLSTAVTRRQLTFMDGGLCFAFLPESIDSLAQRRVPVSETQTFFCHFCLPATNSG